MYTTVDFIVEMLPMIGFMVFFFGILAYVEYLDKKYPEPLLYEIIEVIHNLKTKKNSDKVVYHKGDWA